MWDGYGFLPVPHRTGEGCRLREGRLLCEGSRKNDSRTAVLGGQSPILRAVRACCIREIRQRVSAKGHGESSPGLASEIGKAKSEDIHRRLHGARLTRGELLISRKTREGTMVASVKYRNSFFNPFFRALLLYVRYGFTRLKYR